MERYTAGMTTQCGAWDEPEPTMVEDGSGKYVLHSEAQSEIERLQKDVEYHKGLTGALLRKEDDTWDEALMKAAGLAMKGPEEGGVAKSLAFFAKAEDHWVYRQACLGYARAILELKRS